MSGSIHDVILKAYPELKGRNALLEVIWDDLKSAGFHRIGSMKTTMAAEGALNTTATTLGREFIRFITHD